MIHEMAEIKVKGYEGTAGLYTYILDNFPEMGMERKRPIVLICPGGGYGRTSNREAEAVVMQFLAAGFHGAVLHYSVSPVVYPTALLQLAESVAYLRENKERFHIDGDKIMVLGFSAGGHLAASLGVFWERDMLKDSLGKESFLFRPDGLLLCYPVITAGVDCHVESFQRLLGDRYEELHQEVSLEKQVSAHTPPAFLWHTATDDTVPVENSLLFFQALHSFGIPAELHIYPAGGHGLSLANQETSDTQGYGVQAECQSWMGLAVDWIRHLFPMC